MELNFLQMAILKYTPGLSFSACQTKNCGIYWLDSYNLLTSNNSLKSSEKLKIIFVFLLVLNALQYKQFLCILALPERNAQFIDQICTIKKN